MNGRNMSGDQLFWSNSSKHIHRHIDMIWWSDDLWKSDIRVHATNPSKKTYTDQEDMFSEFRMNVLSNDRQGSYDELWFIDIDSKNGLRFM